MAPEGMGALDLPAHPAPPREMGYGETRADGDGDGVVVMVRMMVSEIAW